MKSDIITVVSVVDAFEIQAHTPGSKHAPGLDVVFDGRQCRYQLPRIGKEIELLRPDGSTSEAQVEEIKEHGDGRSFFFLALHKSDAPIGTVMSWSTEKRSRRHQRQATKR